MRVALFGGAGYLGQHLAQELRDRKHEVKLFGRGDKPFKGFDVMFQLACPRNKPDRWSFRAAERAMFDSFKIEASTKILISSMSIFDAPDNEYAQFKRMAERWVEDKGWSIVRLPTLLGTFRPVGRYRADLGLHQIAASVAENKEAFVDVNARRYVESIVYVCESLCDLAEDPLEGPVNLDHGIVYYTDIVPSCVKRVSASCGSCYAPAVGYTMGDSDIDRLRDMFEFLVEQIAERTAYAI